MIKTIEDWVHRLDHLERRWKIEVAKIAMTNMSETERLLQRILEVLEELKDKIPSNGQLPKLSQSLPMELAKEPPPEIVP